MPGMVADGCRAAAFRPPAGCSDASAAAVSDADLSLLDDDRDGPAPLGPLQHLVEKRLVLENVVVLDFVPLFLVGLTGCGGVGSGVLAEDPHRPGHGASRPDWNARW